MRQLIYHYHPGRLFALRRMRGAVRLFPGVPRRINEARIADFLENRKGIDLTSDLFSNQVLRLPPAHGLTVDANGLKLRRYGNCSPSRVKTR